MDITKILLLLGAAGVVIFIIKFLEQSGGKKQKTAEAPLPIEKKPFIFDAMSELALYRRLVEMFSGQYYIFPQMSYGRIIQVKSGADKWKRATFKFLTQHLFSGRISHKGSSRNAAFSDGC